MYLIQIIILLFGLSTPVKFGGLRLAVFNSTVIDYLAVSFRTMGHYPLQKTKTALDILSYFLACFTLICFILEICYMTWVINGLQGVDGKKMTALQKNTREVLFDGLNEKSVKKSWFVRNYNLLYLLRFLVFMSFLFGLQYLQIFQALFSFILMITFTMFTFYYQLTRGLFDSASTSVIKMIQECSIAVIMIMVNTFCLDSFKGFLTSKAKTIMVLVFMVLLLLNIFLEFVSVVITIAQIFTKKKGRGETVNPKHADLEVGKVFDLKKIGESGEGTDEKTKNSTNPLNNQLEREAEYAIDGKEMVLLNGNNRAQFMRERKEIILNSARKKGRRRKPGKVKNSRKMMKRKMNKKSKNKKKRKGGKKKLIDFL